MKELLDLTQILANAIVNWRQNRRIDRRKKK